MIADNRIEFAVKRQSRDKAQITSVVSGIFSIKSFSGNNSFIFNGVSLCGL